MKNKSIFLIISFLILIMGLAVLRLANCFQKEINVFTDFPPQTPIYKIWNEASLKVLKELRFQEDSCKFQYLKEEKIIWPAMIYNIERKINRRLTTIPDSIAFYFGSGKAYSLETGKGLKSGNFEKQLFVKVFVSDTSLILNYKKDGTIIFLETNAFADKVSGDYNFIGSYSFYRSQKIWKSNLEIERLKEMRPKSNYAKKEIEKKISSLEGYVKRLKEIK